MTRIYAIGTLLAWACGCAIAAPESADVDPPRCDEISISDSTPLDGVKVVSAGHITPGPALHLELMPGEACDPRLWRPGWCTPNVAGGAAGVQIHRYKSWACVVVPGQGKLATVSGWISASRWSADQSASKTSWVGIWQNDHAKLSVTTTEGRLHLVGNAIWQGVGDPHFGSFEFDATLQTDVVGLSGECEVQIRKVGDFLFAQDNKQCGGTNVSFDGLYRYRGDLRP